MSVQTEIVIPAMQDIHAVASGETPATSELNDAFQLLNQIIGSWSNDGTLVYAQQHGTFAMFVGLNSITMGPGGIWNTASRPMKIWSAVASNGTFQKGVDVVSMPELRAKEQNGLGITATLPEVLAHDNALPLISVRVYPPPNSAATSMEVDYFTALAAFGALSDATTSLPQGYILAMRHALAIALCPSYEREATQTLTANAGASLGKIQDLNRAIAMPPAPPAQQ